MKPDNNIAIIGGGLGGLACGAILAKEGRKVTVVEKNPRVGGCLQSYSRFGVVFDTGMHVFGGMAPDGNIRRICRYLNIEHEFETLDFSPEATAEVIIDSDGQKYVLALDRNRFVDSLSTYFPAERQGLAGYLAAVDRVMDDLDLFHLRPTPLNSVPRSEDFMMAADAFIAKYVSDPRLRSILASVNLLYGGVSGITPAYLHCAITTIFLNGACRVAGGYSSFADALVGCITAHGGEIITGDAAVEIETADGRAVGVVTASGRHIAADQVISSLPIESMLSMVADKPLFSKSYRAIPERKQDSTSAFIVNIKLKPETMRFSNAISFWLADCDSAWSCDSGLKAKKIMYMTPPVKGQGPWAETLCAIVPMDWSAVSRWDGTAVGRRGADYERFKADMTQLVVSRLSTALPMLADAIEAVDTASPLTIRDFTGVRHGGMCGYRNDCSDIIPFLPVNTRVPNIFLTGQNVNMHGFCGVALTAIQTCEAILGRNCLVNKLSAL